MEETFSAEKNMNKRDYKVQENENLWTVEIVFNRLKNYLLFWTKHLSDVVLNDIFGSVHFLFPAVLPRLFSLFLQILH